MSVKVYWSKVEHVSKLGRITNPQSSVVKIVTNKAHFLSLCNKRRPFLIKKLISLVVQIALWYIIFSLVSMLVVVLSSAGLIKRTFLESSGQWDNIALTVHF